MSAADESRGDVCNCVCNSTLRRRREGGILKMRCVECGRTHDPAKVSEDGDAQTYSVPPFCDKCENGEGWIRKGDGFVHLCECQILRNNFFRVADRLTRMRASVALAEMNRLVDALDALLNDMKAFNKEGDLR